MTYLKKVLKDVQNKINSAVLQREDITGDSSFGAALFSAQQKSFGTGSYNMTVPMLSLLERRKFLPFYFQRAKAQQT